jgi:hypothetical protein
VTRRNANLTSIGIPLGTLAIVAGCSGGASVAPAPVVSGIAGAPTLASGQTMPVTILINPPRRDAATRRLPASRKTKYQPYYTASGVIKIGVTVFAGTVTPMPSPTESLFTVPAVSSTSSPSPYPISVNVPVGSSTFIVREYNGSATAGTGNPNGYLLSTYTSATPIPIYLNATNKIAITTAPVVSSVSFNTGSVKFWENQSTAQTSAPVKVRLADVEGFQIDVPAANPVQLTASIPGLLGTAGAAPIPQTTNIPLIYPIQANRADSVGATIPGLPNGYVSLVSPLVVTPDYYLFFGKLGGGIDIFEAAPYFAGTQTTPAFNTSVPSPSPQLIGAQPGCGGYLAQVLGTSDSFSNAFTVDLPTMGPASTRTMVLNSPSETGRALAPSSCSGYVLSTGGSGGYLYSIGMSLAMATSLNSVLALSTPTGLALDPLVTTLYTSDSNGYLSSYNYGTNAEFISAAPAVSPVGLVVGNGRIFQATTGGYLYGYTSATSARATIGNVGGTPVALTISNDGAKLFVGQGNTIYFADNSTAMPTGLSKQVTLPGGALVTAMAVTPDNGTLLVASGSNNVLYKFALANIVTGGFAAPAVAAAIPANTQTFAISP